MRNHFDQIDLLTHKTLYILELENIINRFDYRIESYVNYSNTYQAFVIALLEDYLKEIQNTNNLYGTLQAYDISESELKNDLEIIINGLVETINHYFQKSSIDGVALQTLKKVIDTTKLFYNHAKSIRPNQLFFRLRSFDNANNPLLQYERKDLFHIAFEDRGIASTNRYSLTGYPCLYLANSTFVAWEEMRKQSKEYACSMFVNQIPLRFIELDSTPFNYRSYNNDNEKYDDLIDYALLFPLIAACSLKVREHQDKPSYKFKAEYVISQLLLESLRDKFNGVKYRSTRIPDFTEEFWNFAIPPKQISDVGYCTALKRLFTLSDVKIFDFSDPLNVKKGSDRFINQDVLTVMIGGQKIDFKDTIFAEIEQQLMISSKMMDF